MFDNSTGARAEVLRRAVLPAALIALLGVAPVRAEDKAATPPAGNAALSAPQAQTPRLVEDQTRAEELIRRAEEDQTRAEELSRRAEKDRAQAEQLKQRVAAEKAKVEAQAQAQRQAQAQPKAAGDENAQKKSEATLKWRDEGLYDKERGRL